VFHILILQGLRDTAFLINYLFLIDDVSSLAKQRMTSKSLDHHGEPPNKVCFLEINLRKFYLCFLFFKAKFEPNPVGEVNQDTLIRHLQYRMNDLRDDNRRLRDHQRDDDVRVLVNKKFYMIFHIFI
jgi:hypothetical protein